jgi:hypothetical protein
MATTHQPASERKSNSRTLWTAIGVLLLAIIVYVIATGAWSPHSAVTGADRQAQNTPTRTTTDGQPATGTTPKGELPSP